MIDICHKCGKTVVDQHRRCIDSQFHCEDCFTQIFLQQIADVSNAADVQINAMHAKQKWLNRKKFAYWFIIQVPFLTIIGLKFGLLIQMLMIVGIILNELTPFIVDLLMEKW